MEMPLLCIYQIFLNYNDMGAFQIVAAASGL